jgi:hypothetical protein
MSCFFNNTIQVVNKDLDPALHYTDLPKGCRLSNGIAVMVMVILLLTVYVLANLKATNRADLPKPRVEPNDMDRVYYRDNMR